MTIGPHVLLLPLGGACEGCSKHKKEELAMKTLFRLFVISLGLITFALSPAWAEGLAIPNTFIPGTTAKANEVNQNFSAVAAALPMVWASTDEIYAGVFLLAGSGSVETNSVSINLPSDGYLVISGNIFINNNGVAGLFYISPYVDGSDVLAYTSAVAFEAQADGVYGEMISVSYTVTVPITSGTHTVSQEVAGDDDGAYFYNRNNMTVLFIPSSQGTYIAASMMGAFATGIGSANGIK